MHFFLCHGVLQPIKETWWPGFQIFYWIVKYDVKRGKTEHFFKTNCKSFLFLKLTKYLFENSAQAFSLIAIRNGVFPPRVGRRNPLCKYEWGRERGPIGIRIAWRKNGRGHYSWLLFFTLLPWNSNIRWSREGKRPAVVAGEIGTNRELDFKLVSSYKYFYNILMWTRVNLIWSFFNLIL